MSDTGITKLTILQAIRRRPGMYMGSLGSKGLLRWLTSFVGNLSALALRSRPSTSESDTPLLRLEFEILSKGSQLAIRTSGLPQQVILEAIHRINTIIVEARDFTPGSLGCVHLDLNILVATTKDLVIEAKQGDALLLRLHSDRGDYRTEIFSGNKNDKNLHGPAQTLTLEFGLDPEIWNVSTFGYEQITRTLRECALLNSQLEIVSEDRQSIEHQRRYFHYPRGILNELDEFSVPDFKGSSPIRLDIETNVSGHFYRIGIVFGCGKNISSRSWCGPHETVDGGSHMDGAFKGAIAAIESHAASLPYRIQVTRQEIEKNALILVALSGRMSDIRYWGATKDRVHVPKVADEVKDLVRNHLSDYFSANPAAYVEVAQLFRIWE